MTHNEDSSYRRITGTHFAVPGSPPENSGEQARFNPLADEPVPDSRIHRVHNLARDLAYGAAQGLWGAEIVTTPGSGPQGWVDCASGKPLDALLKKWGTGMPDLSLLVSFGYLEVTVRDDQQTNYLLTQRAFELLDQPAPQSIFISYRRSESSAFALLLLARFRLHGLSSFMDMNIEPGTEWHSRLELEIGHRENFVCLVGPNTLESEYVRQEVLWALDADAHIVPIWHNGFNETQWELARMRYKALEAFFGKQAIQVDHENPVAYETAIIQLLNHFDVTPA
jgi:hypothetical protein